jgi:hypothetical protein
MERVDGIIDELMSGLSRERFGRQPSTCNILMRRECTTAEFQPESPQRC